ncbi:hypothetical protein CU098_011661 [Rhizopus stolonifer]|uniref:Uncharacterized protein n=1 Tax=Rhizopus stolonifer TaxID=4846 RepID=A0A367KK81_RHIST|nr:hypothetical protein CU098_011661 [Rhizopus stolonifer]
MMILWFIGAVFAATGVWNYLELGTMLPRSGGEQEYLAYQYPRPRELISFVFLMIVGVFGNGSGLAQGSAVFGSNILYAIGGSDYTNDWAARGFAVFCLVFWLVLNIVSTKAAIHANNAFTILKVVILILLICVGFAGLAGRFPNQPDLSVNFSFQGTLNNPGSYANAIYYVIYAYGGWSNLNYVIDELQDPIKNLPKCSIAALALVTVLYLLANVAYLAVLSLDMIINSNSTVAANFFDASFGGIFGSRVLPVLIGLSSFGTMGSLFYSGSRIILEAARKGYLPYDRFFGKVHPRLQSPIPALSLLFLISLIFLLAPPPGVVFEFIIAFAGYGTYFFSASAVVGLLIMRRTQPNVKRPVKVPLVPYLVTISIALLSVGIWYYRVVYKDSLSKSYNAEIRANGQQTLFDDVYQIEHDDDSVAEKALEEYNSKT